MDFNIGDIAIITAKDEHLFLGINEGDMVRIVDYGFWHPWYFVTKKMNIDYRELSRDEIVMSDDFFCLSKGNMALLRSFNEHKYHAGDIAIVAKKPQSGFSKDTMVRIISVGLSEGWYLTAEYYDEQPDDNYKMLKLKDFKGKTPEEIIENSRIMAHSWRDLMLVNPIKLKEEKPKKPEFVLFLYSDTGERLGYWDGKQYYSEDVFFPGALDDKSDKRVKKYKSKKVAQNAVDKMGEKFLYVGDVTIEEL